MKYSRFLSSSSFKVLFNRNLINFIFHRLIVCFIFCSIVCFVGVSYGNNQKNPPDNPNLYAEHLTQKLSALFASFRQATPVEQKLLLDELIDLAAERQKLLAMEMEENPAEVLRLALPERLRRAMPSAVKDRLEKHMVLEGLLEVSYEDYMHTSRLRYVLNANGKRFALHFKDKPPKVLSGARVSIHGVQVDGAMAVESGETSLQILALGDETSGGDASASNSELSNTFGEQRTVVLLVNFQDSPEEQPYSLEEAQALVFGSVSDFYYENSFGQTWLSGDVYGWYTLPFDQPTDSANCKAAEVAQAAQNAVRGAGVDLSAFNRYIYVFPQTPCFPSGSATVGGDPSEAWINGSWFRLKTVAHELGHNLGLYHSGALECGDTTLGSDCQTFVYGDIMDIMGNQSVGHFNAFQKERLGWLNPNLGDIGTAFVDGSYSVGGYETASGSMPKAVKVLKNEDSVTGEKRWYYIEYRQAIGFDDFLAGNENVLNGVVVRMATESDPGSSVLLDVTPNSSTSWDWGDPALVFGQTFTDPESGVSITGRSGDGSRAMVDISFKTTGCVRANPTVTFPPSESQWVAAGTPVTYTLAVTNNDSEGCRGSNFDLAASISAGWTAVYGTEALFLAPGTSASTTLEITSSPSAVDGFYAVDITARNSGYPGYVGTASVTYVVNQQSGNEAPTAVDDSATTMQDTPVVIDVLSNDSDPNNDPLSISGVTQGSVGAVSVNADGKAIYTPQPRAKGQDRFSYTVTDGEYDATATVQVSINRNSGGGGKDSGGNGKGKKK